MSMRMQRTGGHILNHPDPSWGVRAYQQMAMGAAFPWWNPDGSIACAWAAYQPKGAASLAASYTDLTGNGNNCGVGVAPTWDAVNGWKFNGINQYLTTTFVPQNDQSQSMIIQYSNCTAVGVEILCGMNETGVGGFYFYPNYTGTNVIYGNGANRGVAPGLLAGNLCVAGTQGYRNGIAEGAAIGAWTGVPTFEVLIGAWRWNFGVGRYCPVYVQAFALYDCTLTAPQVALVAAAMAIL